MITEDIYRKFLGVKEELTPGVVLGRFTLTKEGAYLYRHKENSLAEIIEFVSKEAEQAYITKCRKIHDEWFGAN